MAEGSPDFTNNVRLLALAPDGSLVTIAADAAGRLVAALYGSVALDGPIDVTQVDSSRIMRGLDGATLRTIMVDAAGRIVSVMTGDYAGTPVILAVDEHGNITATMTAEYDGAAVTLAANAAHQLVTVLQDAENLFGESFDFGLGELAVRLGSPSIFERRGSVMWFDDFRHGLGKWYQYLNGAGSAIALSNKDAKFGGFSALLTAGAAAGRSALLAHRESLLNLTAKIGVEASFQTQDANHGDFGMEIDIYDGTNGYKFEIMWSSDGDGLHWWDETGGYDDIATVLLASGDNSWASIKLVVDAALGQYLRVYVNGHEYSMADEVAETWADATPPSIEVILKVVADGAAAVAALFDNVIITTNEPAA